MPEDRPRWVRSMAAAVESLALAVIPALWSSHAAFGGMGAMDSLVSTDWLAGELGASDLGILDASFFLPADGRDALAEFGSAHIPGAVFLDLAGIVNRDHPVPGMLPSAQEFAGRMEA